MSVSSIFPKRTSRERADLNQVAAAIHRMNKEPGMQGNAVWADLTDYFNRRWPGNGWEAPF